MENRNYIVDVLRFIAVTWVALFHFNETTVFQNNWYRLVVKNGFLGVPIFFVISGYCIALSINHTTSITEFITRRFFRIFPTYWLSLFIVLFAVGFSLILYGANSVATLPKNLLEVGALITLLTYPFSSISTINWVYWSLTVEIFFYIVIAIYMLVSKKYRFIWILAISILPFFCYNQESGVLFFIKYWPSFLLGFSTFRLLMKQELKNIFLVFLALLTLMLYGIDSSYFRLTCVTTICIIIIGHLKPIRANILSSIGNYSYSIYLIHVPIGVNILGYIKQFTIVQQNVSINILCDLISLAFILLISRTIYLNFELPLILFGKKYLKKQESALKESKIN